MNLTIGKPAPQFTLEAYRQGDFTTVSSSDFRGRWLVLFFYPRDFTFVCPTELKAFAVRESDFKDVNAALVACSTDSTWSHKEWFSKDLPDVMYPVLADTAHTLARDFGVLIEESGEALRGTFIIDPEGVLRYTVISDLNVGRSVDETLRVLHALQTGGLCPADWKKGSQTLESGSRVVTKESEGQPEHVTAESAAQTHRESWNVKPQGF